MLEARNGSGTIKAFPRAGVKGKGPVNKGNTGLQNKTFHCEICDVHVNSETQLKQVGSTYSRNKKGTSYEQDVCVSFILFFLFSPPIHPFICPPIHPFICLCIYPSIHPSIHLSIDLPSSHCPNVLMLTSVAEGLL